MPSEGSITFAGTDVSTLPSFRRASLGMARTFQNIRIFGAMTVLENVLTGMHPALHAGLASVIFRLPSFRIEERQAVARARAALDLVGLTSRAGEPASALAYGDQRRLEIARAIGPQPRLLLLDEPAAGMNPAETIALADLVRTIAKTGVTVILVEHDMGFVMGLSDSVAVLNFGRRIFTGTPAAVRSDPAVVEAYLGARLAAKLKAQHDAQ